MRLEKEIHRHFSHLRGSGEWFTLDPADILPILDHFGIDGFVGTTDDSFEVTGHDRDGVPEYLGVWNWGDLEWDECRLSAEAFAACTSKMPPACTTVLTVTRWQPSIF